MKTAMEMLLDDFGHILRLNKDQKQKYLTTERKQIEEAYSEGSRDGSRAANHFEWGAHYKEQTPSEYYESEYLDKPTSQQGKEEGK